MYHKYTTLKKENYDNKLVFEEYNSIKITSIAVSRWSANNGLVISKFTCQLQW